MFLVGLIGLAAMGGAAFAVGDLFDSDEEEKEEDIIEDEPPEVSEENFLDVGENVDTSTAIKAGGAVLV